MRRTGIAACGMLRLPR